jgi:hypothetical protein
MRKEAVRNLHRAYFYVVWKYAWNALNGFCTSDIPTWKLWYTSASASLFFWDRVLSRDTGRMELNNTIHKSLIHSVLTIITETRVGGMDLACSTSHVALLELVLNWLNSVPEGAGAFKEDEKRGKKEEKKEIKIK